MVPTVIVFFLLIYTSTNNDSHSFSCIIVRSFLILKFISFRMYSATPLPLELLLLLAKKVYSKSNLNLPCWFGFNQVSLIEIIWGFTAIGKMSDWSLLKLARNDLIFTCNEINIGTWFACCCLMLNSRHCLSNRQYQGC